jgi:hypothetical protein
MSLPVLIALVVIGSHDCHWFISFVLNELIVLSAMIAIYAMITMFVCLDYLS